VSIAEDGATRNEQELDRLLTSKRAMRHWHRGSPGGKHDTVHLRG
jgi:hypothetical protein